MENKIYYFDIPATNNKELDKIIQQNLALVLDEKDQERMVFADYSNPNDTFYAFLPQLKIQNIIQVFEDARANIKYQDISQDVLLGRMNDTEFHKTFAEEDNKKLMDEFMRSNLTIDIILDKISLNGMDCLTQIEKEILKDNENGRNKK